MTAFGSPKPALPYIIAQKKRFGNCSVLLAFQTKKGSRQTYRKPAAKPRSARGSHPKMVCNVDKREGEGSGSDDDRQHDAHPFFRELS